MLNALLQHLLQSIHPVIFQSEQFHSGALYLNPPSQGLGAGGGREMYTHTHAL